VQYRIIKVEHTLISLGNKPVDTSGITRFEMKDMLYKINSIEQFLRTTPLVECGNNIAPREDKKY
jgi:hypothetical protein